jgi:serine/threonine protein phosphatase PrpC
MIGRSLLPRRGRAAAERPAAREPEHLQAAARSHVGKVREINEDRFLVRSERGLWAVADGMGGHSAGGDAASAAMDELARLADDGHTISEASIHAALNRANRRIRAGARGHSAVSGTTVVVAWLDGARLRVFWAGDSRAYRLRGGEARRLTRDHSVVQELLDAGAITDAEAERHPDAHLVTRALGAADTVAVEEVVVDFQPGDRLLLCSDGVSRSLDEADVAGGEQAIDRFADGVLRTALRRDGSDNATLVAVQLTARSAL